MIYLLTFPRSLFHRNPPGFHSYTAYSLVTSCASRAIHFLSFSEAIQELSLTVSQLRALCEADFFTLNLDETLCLATQASSSFSRVIPRSHFLMLLSYACLHYTGAFPTSSSTSSSASSASSSSASSVKIHVEIDDSPSDRERIESALKQQIKESIISKRALAAVFSF